MEPGLQVPKLLGRAAVPDVCGLTPINGMRLVGSDDLTEWTQIAGIPASTLRWQDLPARSRGRASFRYLRLTNGSILNVAEPRLYGVLG